MTSDAEVSLFPPSRRTHGVYRDNEAAVAGAHNLVRLLNGVPCGFVLYTATKMGAYAVCSCHAEEMAEWQARGARRVDTPNVSGLSHTGVDRG